MTPGAAEHRAPGWPSAFIFIAVASFLLLVHGNRVEFTNDEGIILDAAQRMLHGERLYKDFFGYMSPGSYWLQEAAFRLVGVSLRSGRLVVICDFALACSLVFWLTARLAGRKAAFAASALFFAFQATQPELLTAQHRWDSSVIALASIALCLEGASGEKPWCWFAGGFAIAAAATCTPSIALLAPVTLVWLAFSPPLRRFLVPYALGATAGGGAILAVLVATGLLGPFVDQMSWLRRNYSAVNVMPYGALIGGYHKPLEAVTGLALVIRAALLICFVLPAVLPIAALAGWVVAFLVRPRGKLFAAGQPIPYLVACMVVYVLTAYPRADVMHLAFVAPIPYVLTAVLVTRYLPPWAALALLVFFVVSAGLFAIQRVHELWAEVPITSPVGNLRANPRDAASLEGLFARVAPGDRLYVHPYMPLLYFLTQAANPTRFSYLAPGLMTRREEVTALAELQSKPPQWILYLPLSREEFLRVFPYAGSLDHRFRVLEAWIAEHYEPLPKPLWIAGYQVYMRR